MSFAAEERHAAHLLAILEDGRHSVADNRHLYEAADPALVHLLFSWLRARYPAQHSASDGVLGRIVELCGASAEVSLMAKQGPADPLVEWFEENYGYKELDRDTFITVIVAKLEG